MDAKIETIKIAKLNDKELVKLSKERLLALNLQEMKFIQEHFKEKRREPTDAELETLAQTWSEHCKHKIFNSRIEYTGEDGKVREIENLFKETIKKATEEIDEKADWLVSVFKDNAGVIKLNEEYNVAFKVETHNHPSALDPYGGSSTGVGGVIRDVLGVGLGAKPIANTDVFCFADPRYKAGEVPKGILHPKRIFKGVRKGVSDYGNRMGIPTVNGAIFFDERFLGNPLVYCGTVGLMKKGLEKKKANPSDLIVVMGGRTGRDGIHGATFASIELTEETSCAAVQIGNAIEEKKTMDALLKARDEGLYTCVTDCGAGGFSSAIGETAKDTGAFVELEKAPLKYTGLLPWEIWVSESQERMVLAVPEKNLKRLKEICEIEEVELTVLGKYTDDKVLDVRFNGETVLKLEMEFLHSGLPKPLRKAVWKKVKEKEVSFSEPEDLGKILLQVLAMPNIASKESTVRQYDHEVQGCSVLKPFTGEERLGPSDGAVIAPLYDSKEGIVIANALNPWFSDIDPYWMSASVIDEAIRNVVACGGSLERIAILDNYCFGNPESPERLGAFARSAFGCYDFAKAFGTPFISGKDSFYNEFILKGKTISIPLTLLISAVGVIKDASKRISMDLKGEGNALYIVGETFNELGGSAYCKLQNCKEGKVPKVNAEKAMKNYNALSKCSDKQVIAAMHDCSDGGLAICVSEMAFAGMLGVKIDLRKVLLGEEVKRNDFVLFSESNSRILVEVKKEKEEEFLKEMEGCTFAKIGEVVQEEKVVILGLLGKEIINASLEELKNAWRKTLNW